MPEDRVRIHCRSYRRSLLLDCWNERLGAKLLELLGRVPDGDDAPSAINRARDVLLTPIGEPVVGHHATGDLFVEALVSSSHLVHHYDCHEDLLSWLHSPGCPPRDAGYCRRLGGSRTALVSRGQLAELATPARRPTRARATRASRVPARCWR